MKPSRYIRSRQCREVRRAARHSYWIDQPLNWQVTIDYGWVEVGEELKPSMLHRDVRRRFWSWWNYKRRKGCVTGPMLDLVVWEAPGGKHHANWLIYIPENLLGEAQLVIKSRCAKVLAEIDQDTIHQQRIYNLNGLVTYILKGTDPDYAQSVGITAHDQGEIWCRRAIPCRALGQSARDRDWRGGRVLRTDGIRKLPLPREARLMKKEKT